VVLGSAELPAQPGEVGQFAVDPATDRVFSGSHQDQGVGTADASRLAFVDASDPVLPQTTVVDHSTGRGVAVSPALNAVWVGTGSSVVRRDLTTFGSMGNAAVAGCPGAIDVDATTGLLYVGVRSSCVPAASLFGRLAVVDGATMAVVGTSLAVATSVHNVHHNAATGKSYLTHNDGADGGVAIIGPAPSLAVLGELPGRMVAVNPVANRLYVRTTAGITIYDGSTDAEIASVPGAFGWRGAVDSARDVLYVPDDSGSIAVVNGSDRAVFRFSLGDGVIAGDRMIVDSAKGRLYVAGSNGTGNARMYVVDLLAGQRCTVAVSASAYGTGEVVSVPVLELRNSQATVSAAVELKVWLGGDVVPPIGIVNAGAAGAFKLPAASVRNYGPFALPPITESWPRGEYEIGCRLLHPVTGRMLSESIATFTVH
jgi:hypothetical protein